MTTVRSPMSTEGQREALLDALSDVSGLASDFFRDGLELQIFRTTAFLFTSAKRTK